MNGFLVNKKINPKPLHRLVSVLFPVYNGAAYLEEAIRSILNQTYDKFEVIIINDGSTDESASIIQLFSDPRIKYYQQENQGLAATLNRAVSLAKGEFLARQDQDDVALPQRFEKQVRFLETHPDHGMVGTWAEIWEGASKTQRVHKHPAESLVLKLDLLFDNPFVHSSMMIRKEVFDKVGQYSTDKDRQPPEDYELWSRVAREFEVANIPEVLQVYREIPGSMSRVGVNPFSDRVINISMENLAYLLGREKQDRDIADLAALVQGAYNRVSPRPDFSKISDLLFEAVDKLCKSSDSRYYDLRSRAKDYMWFVRKRYLKRRFIKILQFMGL